MRPRARVTIIFVVGWWIIVGAMAIGCQSQSRGELPELYSGLKLSSSDWAPILEEKLPAPGDIRELRNCGEREFRAPPRGPWTRIENKELAADSMVIHSTADRVVRAGEPVTLSVDIDYDGEPLSVDWVRLFIGTCNGWSQIAERKTGDSGEVRFELRNQLPAGVYGAAFQVVGDGSVSSTQLWVVPRETKIIGMELSGGAFDDQNNPVEGAASLASWYTNQGHLVAFVDLGSQVKSPVSELRKTLRKEGFPVGPVLRLYEQKADPVFTSDIGRRGEEGGASSAGGELKIDRFYGGDERVDARLYRSGVHTREVQSRDAHCKSLAPEQSCTGWVDYLKKLPQPPPNF